MDILNTIQSALGGGDKNNDLMSVVINLVGGQKGGLDGLISQFTSIGLGDVVGSWVSTGKNLPVSPDQIHNAIGSDQIKIL